MVRQVRIFLKAGLVYLAFLSGVVAVASRETNQELLKLNIIGNGTATLSLGSTDGENPALTRVFLEGRLIGENVNQSWSETELVQMQYDGRPRTVLKHKGLDVLTFVTVPKFDRNGGNVSVGYLRSLGNSRSIVGNLRYDTTSARWWLYYTSPQGRVSKLKTLNVELKTLPFVGITGIKSIQGIDEAGRPFEIPAN